MRGSDRRRAVVAQPSLWARELALREALSETQSCGHKGNNAGERLGVGESRRAINGRCISAIRNRAAIADLVVQ